jgi:hypothetical protein
MAMATSTCGLGQGGGRNRRQRLLAVGGGNLSLPDCPRTVVLW